MKGRWGRVASAVIAVLPLMVWGIMVLYPVFWMFSSSLKTDREIAVSPWALPAQPQWENWTAAWRGRFGTPLSTHIMNSLMMGLPAVGIVLVFSSLCGYSTTKLRLPAGRYLIGLLMVAISVPVHSVIIPLFALMKDIHLLNSYVGLAIVYATYHLPFAVILMRAYFVSFPDEILEAGKVDGASDWQAFWHIAFPMSRGALAAVATISFLGIWNELLLSLILMSNPEMRTLQPALAALRGGRETTWGLVMASLSIVTIIPIALYILFQRQITKGMTMGALK